MRTPGTIPENITWPYGWAGRNIAPFIFLSNLRDVTSYFQMPAKKSGPAHFFLAHSFHRQTCVGKAVRALYCGQTATVQLDLEMPAVRSLEQRASQ